MIDEHFRRVDDRKKKWITYDRLMVWITLATLFAGGVIFWSRGNALPGKMETLEMKVETHCAVQNQRETSLDARLQRIEDKLDRLIERRER